VSQSPRQTKPLLVVILGLSGAGKSTTINALEDNSFRCIDNLPVELLEATVRFILGNSYDRRFALGLDLKSVHDVDEFISMREKIKDKVDLDLLFVTCEEENIIHRYSTTRRKHPLIDQSGQLLSAVRREKEILKGLEKIADVVFNTTSWSPHYLARTIEDRYKKEIRGRNLHVTITSFGFKHGLLKPADEIFDTRFLKNPFFDLKLKNYSGLDSGVQDYIRSDENTEKYLQHLERLHEFLLPNYYLEGKHYFRIGIGCTGGKHRSVYIVEQLAERLAKKAMPHILISVAHRDITAENYVMIEG
jgi:UPF0042 nucleotide-binding protein